MLHTREHDRLFNALLWVCGIANNVTGWVMNTGRKLQAGSQGRYRSELQRAAARPAKASTCQGRVNPLRVSAMAARSLGTIRPSRIARQEAHAERVLS